MGIRFRCPNGHKLNVKAFQTGMRGVCPYCGAKFTVPAEGTQPPTDKPPTDKLPADKPESGGQLEEGGQTKGGKRIKKAGTADPLVEEPDAVWYVRPPSGGQFGPADGNAMRDWLKDGRITADALVWREGWPDWVEAVTVFPKLALVRWLPDDDAAKKPPPPPPSAKPRPEKPKQNQPKQNQSSEREKSSEASTVVETFVEPFVETKPDDRRTSPKNGLAKRGGGRRRPPSTRDLKDRRVTIVIGLSVLTVAMAGVLAWVLMH